MTRWPSTLAVCPQRSRSAGRTGARYRPLERPVSPARASEPDVRVAAHPALRKSMPLGYTSVGCIRSAQVHGEGMRSPR